MQDPKAAPSIPGYAKLSPLRTSPEIWRAQRESDDASVAIWLLDPTRNPVLPSRLRGSRRRLSAATRANDGFVALLDNGVAPDGRPFVAVTDQVSSVLTDRLSAGPIPWKDAVTVVEALSLTMNEAHKRGVVLGDLRPDAVWFDDAGRPMIMPWGMSTRHFDDGAPTFLAPEAQNGGPTSPATDVYSLLLIMAALVLGRPPERGEPIARYVDQAKELFPERLGAALEHGTSAAPENRFGNGRALGAALAAARASIDEPETSDNTPAMAATDTPAQPEREEPNHLVDLAELSDDEVDPIEIVDIDHIEAADVGASDLSETAPAAAYGEVLDLDSFEPSYVEAIGQATIDFDPSLADVALAQIAEQSEYDDPTTIWDDDAIQPVSGAVDHHQRNDAGAAVSVEPGDPESDMAVLDFNALEDSDLGSGPGSSTGGAGLLLPDGSLPTTDLSREQLQQWTRELQNESAFDRFRTSFELFWFRSRRTIATSVVLIGLAAIASVIVFLTARELQAGTQVLSSGDAPATTTTVVQQRNLVIADGVPYLTEVPPTNATTTAPPPTTASTTLTSSTAAPGAPSTAAPAPPTTAAPTARPRPTPAPPTTAEPTTRRAPTTADPTTAPPTPRPRPTTAAPTSRPRPTTAAPTSRPRPTTDAPTTAEVLPPSRPRATDSDDQD